MEYADLKGAKIAVSHFSKWSGMGNDKDVTAAVDATVKALRKAGAKVDVIKFDWKSAEFMPMFFEGLMSTSMYIRFLEAHLMGEDLDVDIDWCYQVDQKKGAIVKVVPLR